MADINWATTLAKNLVCDVPVRIGPRWVGTIHIEGEALRRGLFEYEVEKICARRPGEPPLEGPSRISEAQKRRLDAANAGAVAAVLHVFDELKERAAGDVWITRLAGDTFLRISPDPLKSLTRAVGGIGMEALQLPSSPQILEGAYTAKRLDDLKELRRVVRHEIALPKGRPLVVVEARHARQMQKLRTSLTESLRKVRSEFRRKHGRSARFWPRKEYANQLRVDVIAPSFMNWPRPKQEKAAAGLADPTLKASEVARKLIAIEMRPYRISESRIRTVTRKKRQKG